MYTKSPSENDPTSDTTNIPLKKERVLRTFNSNRRTEQPIGNLNAMRFNRKLHENRKLFDVLNRTKAPYTPIRINRLLSTPPATTVKKVSFNESSIPIPPPLPPVNGKYSQQKVDINKSNDWYKNGVSVVDNLFKGKEPTYDVIINKNEISDENVSPTNSTINELNENMNKMFDKIFKSIDETNKLEETKQKTNVSESSTESSSSSDSESSSSSDSESSSSSDSESSSSSDSETSSVTCESESETSSSISNEWELPAVPTTVPTQCKTSKAPIVPPSATPKSSIVPPSATPKAPIVPASATPKTPIVPPSVTQIVPPSATPIGSYNKVVDQNRLEESFLAPGHNYGINTSIKSKQFSEIENDWITYNSMVKNKTASCSEPVAASQSMSSNYASYSDFGGESLLNNEGDIKTQKTYQDTKNKEVQLASRVDAKSIKILNDNFAETNDHIISPTYMVEELMKVKGRLMKMIETRSILKAANEKLYKDKFNQQFQHTNQCQAQFKQYQQQYNPPLNQQFQQPSNPLRYIPLVNDDKNMDKVQLTDISSNPKIIEKIQVQYSKMYQTIEFTEDTSSLFRYNPSFNRWGNSLGYESKNLLSVLDFLIGKYRSLGDDRKILDLSDDIGYEIKDVVDEYMVVKEKLEKLDKFNKKLNAGRELLKELEQMTNDFGTDSLLNKVHVDMYQTMKSTMNAQIDTLEKSLVDTEINALKKEAEEVQAKFNYYQKMANEVTNRLQIITTQPLNELATYDLRPKKDTDPKTTDQTGYYTVGDSTPTSFDTFSPYPNWDTFLSPCISSPMSKLNNRMYL
jgi:hypothetical protein